MDFSANQAYRLKMIQPNIAYPLKVFYDGQCPLCRREIEHYRRHDILGHLECVDITVPEFKAEMFNLDPVRIHAVMHAQAADGQTLTEVNAFEAIWRAVPPTFVSRILLALIRIPGMRSLMGVGYRAFARNRYRLTGRCNPGSCSPPSGG